MFSKCCRLSNIFVSVVDFNEAVLGNNNNLEFLNYSISNSQSSLDQFINLSPIKEVEKNSICVFSAVEHHTAFFTKSEREGGKMKKKKKDLSGP